jgi:hypothetical protein
MRHYNITLNATIRFNNCAIEAAGVTKFRLMRKTPPPDGQHRQDHNVAAATIVAKDGVL